MRQLIVTDIFGRTDAVDKLASELSGTTEIIDPYDGQQMSFADESQAYRRFKNSVGIEQYSRHLQQQISAQSETVRLVGFSVGASAIWNVSDTFSSEALAIETLAPDTFSSETLAPETVVDAVCFYGSQIRHATTIRPVFPVELILPESEEHFSVSEMADTLRNIKNVQISRTQYLHGFMNPYSRNFNSVAYQQYVEFLKC